MGNNQKDKPIRKATTEEVVQNKKKQQFLNQHGIKVKIDGSWGPWQQKQYDNLQPKQNWFTRATLGAAFAENPAIAIASGWTRKSNGDYVQERTPESDRLADNLGVISTLSPTNPVNILGQGAIKGAQWAYKMARPVFPRGTTNFGNIAKYASQQIGEGAEATVYNNTPRKVSKVIYNGYQKVKNHIPNVEKVKKIGEVTANGQKFPVYSQRKLNVVTQEMWPKVVQKLDKAMTSKGFSIIRDPQVQYRAYRHLGTVIDDIGPGNVGLTWAGQPRIIDFNFQTVPEWLAQGFKLKFGGKLNLNSF